MGASTSREVAAYQAQNTDPPNTACIKDGYLERSSLASKRAGGYDDNEVKVKAFHGRITAPFSATEEYPTSLEDLKSSTLVAALRTSWARASEFAREADELRCDIAASRVTLAAFKGVQPLLKEELGGLQERILSLESSRAQQAETIEACKENERILERVLAAERGSAAKLSDRINKLAEHLEEVTGEKEKVEETSRQQAVTIANMETQQGALETSLADQLLCRATQERLSQKLASELEKAAIRVGEMARQLAEASEASKRLQDILAKEREDGVQLQQQADELSRALEAATSREASLAHQLAEHTNSLSAAAAARAQEQLQTEELRERAAALKARLTEAAGREAGLVEQLAKLAIVAGAAEAALADKSAAADELEARAATLAAELEGAKAHKAGLAEQLASMDAKAKAGEAAFEAERASGERLKQQIAVLDPQLKEASAREAQIADELASMTAKVQAAENTLAAERASGKLLKQQAAAFEAQLEEAKSQLAEGEAASEESSQDAFSAQSSEAAEAAGAWLAEREQLEAALAAALRAGQEARERGAAAERGVAALQREVDHLALQAEQNKVELRAAQAQAAVTSTILASQVTAVPLESEEGELVAEGKAGMGLVDTPYYGRCARKAAEDPATADQLEREASLMMGVPYNPHVAPILAREVDGDRQLTGLLLPHFSNGSLQDLLSAKPELFACPAFVMDAAVAACRALLHLHSHGVVHNAVQLPSLRVAGSGALVLAEFGSAGWVDYETGLAEVPGMVEVFCSPELLEQTQPPFLVTEKEDVFQFGGLLLTLLQGCDGVMSRGSGLGGRLQENEVSKEIRRASKAWPKLARVTRRCLHQNPAERWTMAKVLAELLSID